MTRRDELIKLRDAVKAGERIQPWIFQDALNNSGKHRNCAGEAIEAYSGSLDGAKALDAAIPTHDAVMSPETMALILLTNDGARFWLIWKLDALIAQEGGK
jgi:hypothetical protein